MPKPSNVQSIPVSLAGIADKMIDFIRSLLSKALKGNEHLSRGLMTGVVRTAKDGIISGLNNPKICTMLDCDFLINLVLPNRKCAVYLSTLTI
jgi:hypothetical protein